MSVSGGGWGGETETSIAEASLYCSSRASYRAGAAREIQARMRVDVGALDDRDTATSSTRYPDVDQNGSTTPRLRSSRTLKRMDWPDVLLALYRG